jgi:hypothetical protein
MHEEHVLNETKLISTLNITASYTGILLCNASNDFGSSSYEFKFLVTGNFLFTLHNIINFSILQCLNLQ